MSFKRGGNTWKAIWKSNQTNQICEFNQPARGNIIAARHHPTAIRYVLRLSVCCRSQLGSKQETIALCSVEKQNSDFCQGHSTVQNMFLRIPLKKQVFHFIIREFFLICTTLVAANV